MTESQSDYIDLTKSFTLGDHVPFSLDVIVLDTDTDDSFSVSTKNEHGNKDLRLVSKKKIKVNEPRKLSISKTKNQDQYSKKVEKIKTTYTNRFGDCPICWEQLGSNPLASTKCGHVFCLRCLEDALKIERKCPTCRRVLKGLSSYHPLYLNGD